MVIEVQEDIHSRINTVLEPHGFAVHGFSDQSAALRALKTQVPGFSLVIFGCIESEIKDDTLLSRVREASPQTRRILLANASYINTMVKAINTAQIHACLVFPFADQDLLNQVRGCCQQFRSVVKMESLKHTIQRQNRQLFQIANNFKKKEAADLAQIEDRKKKVRILKGRLKENRGDKSIDDAQDLTEYFKSKAVDFSPQGFGTEFLKMKTQIKDILKTAVYDQRIDPHPLSYQEVIFRNRQDPEHPDLVARLNPLMIVLIQQSHQSGIHFFGLDFKRYMDAHFAITFSPNRDKAFIQIKTMVPKDINAKAVNYYLSWYDICRGIVNETDIGGWLDKAKPSTAPFLVALGQEPVYPKNSEIKYHFPTDFLHAGKISEDGSIDFQDRGEIPFVKADAFLAAKMSAEPGKSGIDVSGRPIFVEDPQDKTFEAGPGTVLSDDGQKIYALIEGQPHLDAMGKITVCPELRIEGDLGFETGDVIFDGNVVINGAVKQGFKVKGASLTAKEIRGAEIDLTGDLNVSLGIVDTELVNVKGSVQAKFIRNSKINAFGDLIVQREIIDSTIYLSGSCVNTAGSIINSEISANMGIDARDIGNDTSKPSKLTVGKDEHTLKQVSDLDSKIRLNLESAAQLNAEITALETEEQALHGIITQHATVQDRSELELKGICEKMDDLKASGNMAAFQKLKQTKAQLESNAVKAEDDINKGFERQDAIAREISQKQKRIQTFQTLNQGMADEKKRLMEYSGTKTPHPQVKVAGTMCSGTQVSGACESMTLYSNQSRCKIVEKPIDPNDRGGLGLREIKILNY